MANQEKTRPHLDESNQIEKDNDFHLILHNDDYNTFDFVIECLVEVCEHDSHQAEQCAYITHYKGKCDVKKGKFEKLSHMKNKLNSKGLTVTID
ncbi:MAG TPA: Clp protease ClpS [Marinilabiliales bacterium]|jgi:ATP-dependent Clp protease adaptor protein ClpS|nr:MAG: hypothetical protein A2W95_05870 [Bacteroidetes bacterium GWA2_40_14]OFX59953.1 MAG: hypothetical protein A2W84_17425 [Bacteroidetes bacterium GWC2_40_13]OFX76256.1 MAG: hypothetical protein A2W96_03455 [Bacteroidetes bacterium GWD2_40_43]OFX95771.1 MAG: hypothetical protein A2W97_15875 [Bacteroidetes bacterium GWE2_40_63]OFY21734.1 MAG: hypothetical protein A2W88_05830 [Bacteroidetes bacterium GWF2_40_13]OFZ23918.1 MAG: hypothetical protein A2437_10270 [Bacteroidetes bacterium RIFOXYC